jgi:isoaspartyl peptidase/L-asparaginase-like protein (Ntn-hydrolase superfamily)
MLGGPVAVGGSVGKEVGRIGDAVGEGAGTIVGSDVGSRVCVGAGDAAAVLADCTNAIAMRIIGEETPQQA